MELSEAPNFFTSSPLPNIPPDIRAEILPDKNLSVIDFLKFPLPVSTRSLITDPQEYLSHLSPTITSIDKIKSIPTPPATVLTELIRSPDVTSSQRRNGTLTSLADAENVDLVGDRIEPGDEGSVERNGRRKRRANQRYAAFWRHYDKDSEWVDHVKK